ncbi:SDR family NAD(P)-dependent oxidoreductase [Oceanobacillus sp. FSL W7-1309]|uniref:SDR family NAD(P)-dependent oxidoreductase n=1 Tax=Oceanobacillus sp. FSL W7-1309 TaxID=2954539 RepID=UPI0030F55EB5
MERFEGKAVLITGAGSGLGRAVALQVAKEGAKLSLVDLNEKGLEETKTEVLEVAPSAEVLLVTANVANEDEVKNYSG